MHQSRNSSQSDAECRIFDSTILARSHKGKTLLGTRINSLCSFCLWRLLPSLKTPFKGKAGSSGNIGQCGQHKRGQIKILKYKCCLLWQFIIINKIYCKRLVGSKFFSVKGLSVFQTKHKVKSVSLKSFFQWH